MKTYRFEGVVTALDSISHGGESRGTLQTFRREGILHKGAVERVPVVSGNAIKSAVFRELGMMHMLEILGMDEGSLSIQAFDFLFSGGSLSKDAARGIDIGYANEIRRLIPLVSVLGGSVSNMIMEGKMRCGKLYPIVFEAESVIPKEYAPEISFRDLLQVEEYTRTDDKKQWTKRRYLKIADLEKLDAAKKAKKDEDVDEEAGHHTQMRYGVETLCAGTRFYWHFALVGATELELQAAMKCVALWGSLPTVGGKASVGHGGVKVEITGREVFASSSPVSEVGTELYEEHVKKHKKEICNVIEELK